MPPPTHVVGLTPSPASDHTLASLNFAGHLDGSSEICERAAMFPPSLVMDRAPTLGEVDAFAAFDLAGTLSHIDTPMSVVAGAVHAVPGLVCSRVIEWPKRRSHQT